MRSQIGCGFHAGRLSCDRGADTQTLQFFQSAWGWVSPKSQGKLSPSQQGPANWSISL